ncbi:MULTISPECIES: HAD family phosphatase [unclassified Mycolicibacterium]|uniref:HAD family hydrolase n=1 Tax=unclassified Mycolicibacterium TaxID=2636767 RepID=UPI001307A3E9|nr:MULTISPECIES: HAD family phosphatase [unclassified Mycolicibacterium]MUL81139.1 HAD family phosphatase [Mycolicibacterium sp. CBMA 329]MUL86905.1 HAD family phosphatase [Mycolicibacterium sp. CBMA 331]MUL98811.1 HAD family phosphatase [Mycolicibacterium sp. CBMA 334]MUM30140.1 HAD family phosphatase [Mycolicibacterium sp. CBMA 295]MUM37202.1 HAD family phosphatase [Mycolicibacterium sp. CBMA 247]
MTQTHLQAVLFDMDGTLVDTEHLWWTAVDEVATAMGRPLTEADQPAVLGRPSDHTAAYLLQSVGPRAPTDLAARLDAEFTDLVRTAIVPRPGATRLLDELAAASVPTAIVSASPRSVVELVRDALGAQLFTTIIGADDTARSKPAPDPYLAAAAALGVDPRDCVAVEDTPVGVAAAEAAGCTVLAVPSTVPIAEAPGRAVLTSLEVVDLAVLASLSALSAGRR